MNGNMLLPFYDNWTFLKTDNRVTLGMIEMQKTRFQPIELPHDWLIYDSKNLYQNSTGWYRKEFDLENGEIEDLGMDLTQRKVRHDSEVEVVSARTERGEKLVLRFDGVYMDSTVFVNGHKIGDWKYGYSTFDMDITPALVKGRNNILVQVRHRSPNSRWYSGAGIYRKVFLKICPVTYLPLDGTYVQTKACEGGFSIKAETEIGGKLNDKQVGVTYKLMQNGELVKDFGWHPIDKDGFCRFEGMVENPKLWDIDDPQCYRLCVELGRKDRPVIIDRQDITVGFRTIEFTTDKGLFLNGRHVKIHGVCEHHDFGCLGSAFHTPALIRKIETLKKMGVNAIRTSHNMPDPGFAEMTDAMGMLVLSEAFDMWEKPKTEYDYARFFNEWVEKDVRSWIRRGRNHPSVFMWSIGNEIVDTMEPHGLEITERLRKAVREHDPWENNPISIGSNYMPWEGAQNCADLLKTAGYNYGEAYYAKHHEEHPDWVMYGSETASIVQSRGIYHFPFEQSVLADEDLQCSALGNSNTSWGANSWEECITDDRDAEFIWGQFIWTGFDYIGEPTPYHTKNSYFGQIDTAGFPKDAFYAFQAEWTDVKKAPMVHVFPYWDFNPGQLIDVRIASNAPEVELIVNGESQGRKKIDHVKGLELIPTWKVPYVPGSITAIAYDENGKEIARETRKSFGDSAKIVLTCEKPYMKANTRDMCFVTVSMVDKDGNPVENAADYVKAEIISGPGRIQGMDNGDSTDYDQYKTTVRKLFSGKLLVVVGSTEEEGEIVLRVTGKDLEPAEITLTTKIVQDEDNFKKKYLEDCSKLVKAELPDRIPVRKVELQAQGAAALTPENPEVIVKAVLFPANTTDTKLEWHAVSTSGVDVNFAKVESFVDADGCPAAKVTALGDGAFYIRCMVKGEDRALLISHIEANAEGFGCANIDPYEFVSAALYSDSIGEIGNGNEKGISFDRTGKSAVVFSNLDFGDFGSDEITIPIFNLSNDEITLDLWIGKPFEEGSRFVTKLRYKKDMIWNVYQAETFKLPERIKGLTTISLLAEEKFHMKGFTFNKLQKTYALLRGDDANKVYGDNFRIDGSAIREIGNNVTITFDDMDFGNRGAVRVNITGSTPLESNAINLLFTNEKGETSRHMVDFKGNGTNKSQEQSFNIERVKGKGKLELVFLPGSNFDLEAIQFSKN